MTLMTGADCGQFVREATQQGWTGRTALNLRYSPRSRRNLLAESGLQELGFRISLNAKP